MVLDRLSATARHAAAARCNQHQPAGAHMCALDMPSLFPSRARALGHDVTRAIARPFAFIHLFFAVASDRLLDSLSLPNGHAART